MSADTTIDMRQPAPPTLPPPDAPADVWDEWSAAIPHECEPVLDVPRKQTGGARRLNGIDAARGLALLGMIAVHVMPAVGDDGSMTLPWRLSVGTSSAMFALLAGVALAFMSGSTEVPSLRRWAGYSRSLAVRAVVIILLGLAIGGLVPAERAGVILPYLGVLFLVVLPFLRLGSRALFVSAGLALIITPVVSHLLRSGAVAPEPVNLGIGDVLAAPSTSAFYILVTGLYPVLTWLPYLLLGAGLGRLDLRARRHVVAVALAGAGLWAVATILSRLSLSAGALERLAANESGRMRLDELTDLLVWGGDGTAPATSWWWLASAAPHTGLPLDLLRTAGASLFILGICLAIATVASQILRPLADLGSMTLTLYVAHLLLLITPMNQLSAGVHFGAQVGILLMFALLWRRAFSRGPLEWAVWRLANPARSESERYAARHAKRCAPRHAK